MGAQYRHHPLRARRRPPKGMHLEQGDITALSASQDSGVLTLRQLDTQLVSLKRQVRPRPPPPAEASSCKRPAVFSGAVHQAEQQHVEAQFNRRRGRRQTRRGEFPSLPPSPPAPLLLAPV